MADENIKQVMLDAITDADNLEQFINGSDSETVLTRLSAEYPTLQKAIKQMFNSGGVPTVPFSSYVSMKNSDLGKGSYAVVLDDVNKGLNGIYYRNETTWELTSLSDMYNSLHANFFELTGDESEVQPTYSTSTGAWITNSGVLDSNATAYTYTSPILVPAGKVLKVISYGGVYVPVAEVDSSGSFRKSLGLKSERDFHTIATPASEEDKYYSVCGRSYEITLFDTVRYDLRLSRFEEYLNQASSGYLSVFNNLDELSPVLDYLEPKFDFESGFFMWGIAKYISNPTVDTLFIDVLAGQTVSLQDEGVIGSSNLFYGEQSDISTGENRYWAIGFKRGGYDLPFDGGIIAVVPKGNKVLIDGTEASPREIRSGEEYYQSKAIFKNNVNAVFSNKALDLKKGDTLTLSRVLLGTVNIIDVSSSPEKVLVSTPSMQGRWQNDSVVYTAPRDMSVLICLHKDGDVKVDSPRNPFSEAIKADIERISGSGHKQPIPTTLSLPEKEFVFATAMNYILKLEDVDGIEYIAMSTDLGNTWNYTENIIGDIVQYHFFSDGTVMLCSPTKVWYSSDYQSFTESTVLDHDGSPFVPTGRHFFSQQNSDKVMIKDGQELFVWGDYVLDGSPVRIWYTTDFGRTIKCAARFGITNISGSPRRTGHVHRVNYRTKDGYFYVTTGDVGDHCMVMKGDYNTNEDSWTWEVLASGDEFKFGTIYFDDVFAYLVTDYTATHLRDKKGIYRTPVHKIGDYSSYVPVYKADPAEWGNIALSRLIVDRNNGYMVLLPDYAGVGVIWVSKDGFNFKKVRITPNVFLGYAIGTNYNGDVYCVAYNSSGELTNANELKLSRGVYNITKALRDAGFKDFMRLNVLSMPSGSVTEQP